MITDLGALSVAMISSHQRAGGGRCNIGRWARRGRGDLAGAYRHLSPSQPLLINSSMRSRVYKHRSTTEVCGVAARVPSLAAATAPNVVGRLEFQPVVLIACCVLP